MIDQKKLWKRKEKKSLLWLVLLLGVFVIASTSYIIYRRRKEEELRVLEELKDLDRIETEVADLEFITEESKMKDQIENL